MNFNKLKTADLRKMAKKQKIKGYEDLERKELIAALKPKEEKKEKPEKPEKPKKEEEKEETPETPEEPEEEPEEPETPELGEGVTEGHVPVGSKAEIMRAHLAKQPKVRILIPLEGKEKPGITVPVTINGYRQNIAKGVYVEVAEQVADMIMKSQKQTLEALNAPLNLSNPQHPKKTTGEGLGNLDA